MRVADGQRERGHPAPRRVAVERGPVVGIEIGTAGGGRRRVPVVGDVVRDARRRHLVGVGVIAVARAESPVGGGARRQVQGRREHVRFGIRAGARECNRRHRRIDRERLQRLVVAPQAVGEEPGDLRLVRQLGVAAEADRLRRVRGPQRHAAACRRAGRVVDAQRAVPDERVGEVVEPRSAVGDAQHVLRVRPLGADGEVVGARVVGQRHLDVVAEAEAGAERQLAAVLLRGEAGRDVEVRLRRGLDLDAPDVAPLEQIELRCDRGVGAEARSALGGALRRVVEHQRAAAARIGRHRVHAVELRDLLPAPDHRHPADAVVLGEVLLIAPADVVRARVEGVGAVGLRERIAEAGEEQPVADVLVALKARRVAVDAAHAGADEELPVGQREQAALGLGLFRRGRLAARRPAAPASAPAWASASAAAFPPGPAPAAARRRRRRAGSAR